MDSPGIAVVILRVSHLKEGTIMSLTRLSTRFKLALGDTVRFNGACRYATSSLITILDGLKRKNTTSAIASSVTSLTRAARICPSGIVQRGLERKILKRMKLLDVSKLDWETTFPGTGPREVHKGIILKKPRGQHEKGVLYVAFENQWLRIFRHADLQKLARDYHIVLGQSWSPPHDSSFLVAATMWPGKLFHLISNFDDISTFSRLTDKAVTVPLLSSSWVHPDHFDVDEPVEKSFDIVMLANFGAYKRHFLLFEALRDMPASTRVLLLGKPWEGRTEQTIMDEARAFGVQERITIRPGRPQEVARGMRSAKVSLIFSGREGSCVVVVESMFCDVPVGVFADATIGSKSLINEKTGRLLGRRHVGAQLLDFVTNHSQYSPREWVIENEVSCFGSTKILNSAIKSKALEWGEEWTADIVAHYRRPQLTYASEKDAVNFEEAYSEFEREYGIPIVR